MVEPCLNDVGSGDRLEEEWRLLQLPTDLLDRIISRCPVNEVPCSLRLVNRAAAAHFRDPQHLQVHLSLPVPHHAFCRRWGQPGALSALTFKQRRHLLCLTARSGNVGNLQFLASRIGCPLADDVLIAAASSGQLDSCRWLRSHACPCSAKVLEAAAAAGHLLILHWLWGPHIPLTKAALIGAARNGHSAVCEWLLSCDCPWSEDAPAAAAYGGHVALVYDLLDERPTDVDYSQLLVAAADGFDVAALQSLIATVLDDERRLDWQGRVLTDTQGRMLSAAASSATPGSRAKMVWMRREGYKEPAGGLSWSVDWARIAAGPEPLARFDWLLRRGAAWANPDPVVAFAAAGNIEALQKVLDRGTRITGDAAAAAASAGHLAAIEALRVRSARGGCWVLTVKELLHVVVPVAARKGHLHVVEWAVQRRGRRILDQGVFTAAAESGSVELMAWLRKHGCQWSAAAVVAAADAGCEAALKWLAERGCPMPESGEPYVRAALQGDTATLACLRRLGCPWGPAGSRGVMACVLRRLTHRSFGLPMLRWLVAEGCPVNWCAALKDLRGRGVPWNVSAWIWRECRRQRRRQRQRNRAEMGEHEET